MYMVGSTLILDPQSSLHASSFATVEDNALAIGGWQSIQDDNNILFMLVDNNLQEELARKVFGTKYHQEAHNIIYTPRDRGFALTGLVDLGVGQTSMLLKIDSDWELK